MTTDLTKLIEETTKIVVNSAQCGGQHTGNSPRKITKKKEACDATEKR